MRIVRRIQSDPRRSAILRLAQSLLGPLYDPDKEDEYVTAYYASARYPIREAFRGMDWSKVRIVNGLRRRIDV